MSDRLAARLLAAEQEVTRLRDLARVRMPELPWQPVPPLNMNHLIILLAIDCHPHARVADLLSYGFNHTFIYRQIEFLRRADLIEGRSRRYDTAPLFLTDRGHEVVDAFHLAAVIHGVPRHG